MCIPRRPPRNFLWIARLELTSAGKNPAVSLKTETAPAEEDVLIIRCYVCGLTTVQAPSPLTKGLRQKKYVKTFFLQMPKSGTERHVAFSNSLLTFLADFNALPLFFGLAFIVTPPNSQTRQQFPLSDISEMQLDSSNCSLVYSPVFLVSVFYLNQGAVQIGEDGGAICWRDRKWSFLLFIGMLVGSHDTDRCEAYRKNK